jgi:hypothetical protein
MAAGTNGIPVVGNGTTDPQAFFDQLDNLVAAVPVSTAPTVRSTPTPRSWRRSAPRVAASVAWTRSART